MLLSPPSVTSWTILDLECGSIIWALKRLRGYIWSMHFKIYTHHKALTSIVKAGEHNARVQQWSEYVSNFTYTLIYRRAPSTVTPTSSLASRCPQLLLTSLAQTALAVWIFRASF